MNSLTKSNTTAFTNSDINTSINISSPETLIINSISAISTKATSKMLTTLLSKAESTMVRTTQDSTFDVKDVLIPSLDTSKPKEHILERLMKNSRVISDMPEYFIPPNTPLTAPELDLMTVSENNIPVNWIIEKDLPKLGSAHTEELGWIIPAVIGVLFVFIFLAALCFYGVRKLELKLMWCCFRNFGCCRPTSRTGSDDEMAGLTSNMAAQTEMKAYQSHSAVDFD